MCLLIVQRRGAETLPDQHLVDGWDNNDDGGGYAFIANGKLVIRRAYFTLDNFVYSYLSDHEKYGATSPFIVHLRTATHGGVSAQNTHPFPLAGGRAVMAHNGILSAFDSPVKGESDTAFFVRTVLAHRDPSQLTGQKFREFLEGLVGKHNKLALMDASGNVSIMNEKEGHWLGATWYSNYGYEPHTSWKPFADSFAALTEWEKEHMMDLDTLDDEEWKELVGRSEYVEPDKWAYRGNGSRAVQARKETR